MFVFTPRMRNSRSARSIRPIALVERRAPGGDLHQQRVEVGRDDRAAEPVAAVQPDREPAGRAVGGDPAVVGDEVVLRVLGGDPALDRVRRAVVISSCGGMFSGASCSLWPWATRIWLLTMSTPVTTSVTVCSTWMRGLTSMKKNSPRSRSTQELDGAGVAVVGRLAQPLGGVADPLRAGPAAGSMLGAISTTFWCRRCTEQSRSQRWTRLPCVSPRICTSMCLARPMYRSMNTSPRPNAAPASRWASSSLPCSSVGVLHDAHPAPAAAEAGLDDERVADLLGGRLHLGRVGQAVLGAGDGGHVRLLRQPLGGGLVAERFEQLRRRADERDAVVGARPGQVGVLGQEAVAGVDRVHPVLLGDGDERRRCRGTP